jgi:hypothetical protein
MYNVRYLVFGHIVLFILFLSLLPSETFFGFERVMSAFLIGLLIAYGSTLDWRKSFWAGLIFALVIEFLNPAGPFADLRTGYSAYEKSPSNMAFAQTLAHRVHQPLYQKYAEGFEDKEKSSEKEKKEVTAETYKDPSGLEPAGAFGGDPGKPYGTTKTYEKESTSIKEDDLEQMLKDDEDSDRKEFNKQGGAMAELGSLIDMAKSESPYSNKKMDEYTPAQAQKATYRLIDTVKQLKETMESMGPTLKAGKSLIDLYKGMSMDKLSA